MAADGNLSGSNPRREVILFYVALKSRLAHLARLTPRKLAPSYQATKEPVAGILAQKQPLQE